MLHAEPRAVVLAAHEAQAFIVQLQQLHQQHQQLHQQWEAASNGLVEHVKAVLVLHEGAFILSRSPFAVHVPMNIGISCTKGCAACSAQAVKGTKNLLF